MAEMTPERLAHIRFADRNANERIAKKAPGSAIAHRRELLAEVDRLTAKLTEARSLRLAHPADAVDPERHTPERVRAHLQRLGWVREGGGRVAELWHPVGAPGQRVTVPLIPTAPNYAKALGFLVSDLADLYGPGQLVVLAAIEAAQVSTNVESPGAGSDENGTSVGASGGGDA